MDYIDSCLLFWINQSLQFRLLTRATFEWAFPTLSWQLLFINGMVVGYHHQKVMEYIGGRKNRVLIIFAGVVCLAFLVIDLNNPEAVYWPWRTYATIDASSYTEMYVNWLQKSNLGIGRVINNIALFIVFYYVLSHYWLPINKVLGWLLIPLGQASLYVFILHVYFIILFSNLTIAESGNFVVNTAIHAATILIIWGMVKLRFLFRFVPR